VPLPPEKDPAQRQGDQPDGRNQRTGRGQRCSGRHGGETDESLEEAEKGRRQSGHDRGPESSLPRSCREWIADLRLHRAEHT